VERTRKLSRLTEFYLPPAIDRKARQLCAAFAWCVMAQVRGWPERSATVDFLSARLSVILPSSDVDRILQQPSKTPPAHRVLRELAKLTAENFTGSDRLRADVVMEQMINQINELDSALNACERLRRTPIPLSFGRHGLRCLTIFLFGLPHCGKLTPIYLGILAFITLGIDQSALQLEEPFGILPLMPLCLRVEEQMGMTGLGKQ